MSAFHNFLILENTTERCEFSETTLKLGLDDAAQRSKGGDKNISWYLNNEIDYLIIINLNIH